MGGGWSQALPTAWEGGTTLHTWLAWLYACLTCHRGRLTLTTHTGAVKHFCFGKLGVWFLGEEKNLLFCADLEASAAWPFPTL